MEQNLNGTVSCNPLPNKGFHRKSVTKIFFKNVVGNKKSSIFAAVTNGTKWNKNWNKKDGFLRSKTDYSPKLKNPKSKS
jgi:hypothetical protein